MIIIIIKRLLL